VPEIRKMKKKEKKLNEYGKEKKMFMCCVANL
jgi:hypothetical protein